jgi:hypothetical protein
MVFFLREKNEVISFPFKVQLYFVVLVPLQSYGSKTVKGPPRKPLSWSSCTIHYHPCVAGYRIGSSVGVG